MAITFTPVTLQDKSSILRPIGAEFAGFGTSEEDMTDMTIYVDLGMFVDAGTIKPVVTSIPEFGYSIPFPASGTVTMNKLGHQNSYFWENGKVKIQRTSDTTFTLTLEALMTMDLQGMLGNVGLDTVQRLTKNARSNPQRLNNNAPAVYNKAKVLRLLVVVADADDAVIEYGYLDVPWNSRWFGMGLNGGDPEFEDFDYKFINLTVFGTTPGFSFNVDNAMRFYASGDWTGGGCFIIWKDTDNANAATFMADTNMSFTYFSNAGVLSQVYDWDNSAFVSCGPVTTIASDRKYVDIVLDKDYFVNIGKDPKFRIAFLPFKTNDYSNSFITGQLEVTDFVLPTSGDITDTIENYTLSADPFEKCAKGIAVNERLRFTVLMDKASYDAAILTNLSTGTFDDNFLEVKMYISDDAIPDGDYFDPANGELITDYGLINTFNEAGIQTTVRMRPEWAGTIKYITTEFTFKIYLDNGTDLGDYTIEKIYYQQYVSIAEPLSDNSDIELVSMKSLETDEDIDKICGDTGIIQLVYKNNTENDYDLIGWLEGEFDGYSDGAHAFVKLNQATGIFNMNTFFIESGGGDLPIEKIALVNIDTSKLDFGKEYCFQLIGLNKSHIEGDCPESGSLSVTLRYLGGLTVEVEYSGLDVDPFLQMEMRVHPVSDKPVIGGDQQFTFFESSGTTGNFLGYGHGFYKTFNINIVVITENGCKLSGNKTFQVSKWDDEDTQTIDLT